MDTELFLKYLQYLQYLLDHTLEEGRAYIQTHVSEIADHASFGDLFAEEALEQLYTNPAVSLKLAELLIFFGEHIHHASSHALGLKAKGDALRAIGLHQAAIECLDAAGLARIIQLDGGVLPPHVDLLKDITNAAPAGRVSWTHLDPSIDPIGSEAGFMIQAVQCRPAEEDNGEEEVDIEVISVVQKGEEVDIEVIDVVVKE